MQDRKKFLEETDSFWELDAMLPPRDSRVFSHDTDTVRISLPQDGAEADGEKIPASDPGSLSQKEKRIDTAKRLLAMLDEDNMPSPNENVKIPPAAEPVTYTPENASLVTSVTLRQFPTPFTFHDRFLRDAERYLQKEGTPCQHVPFFSYMPQYSQMDAAQKNWYFCLRSCLRTGTYPDTDFSYLLLFLYEILNLPDRIPPKEGVLLMAQVWAAYRKAYPRLDAHLSEWIGDYCLIHRVPLPYPVLKPFYPTILSITTLKSFFFQECTDDENPMATALLQYGCMSRWRQSRYVTPENEAFFETHIRAAFLAVYEGNALPAAAASHIALTHTTRDAYHGALCTYENKRQIDLTCFSCYQSMDLRYMITDTVKYIENQIHALLGIKGRYHVSHLPAAVKDIVNAYFQPLKDRKKKKEQKEKAPDPVPAYDSLYEPAPIPFSPENARAIEQSAWRTTALLTQDEEEGSEDPESISSVPIPPPSVPPTMAPLPEPSEPEDTAEPGASSCPERIREALACLFDGNQAGFARVAQNHHLLPDTLAEEINDAACEEYGDIAVEITESGYSLLTDYKEELLAWMNR